MFIDHAFMYMYVPARSNGLLGVLDRGHSLVPKCYTKNVMFTCIHLNIAHQKLRLQLTPRSHRDTPLYPFLNSVVEAESLLQVHVCHSK